MSVRIEKNNHVTTVIIDRAHVRNAVDAPTARALVEAFREFARDENARVAVFTGAGGNFCAGADLKAIAAGEHMNELHADGDAPMGPSRMLLGKPVLAALAGYAVAGGLELALWCDLRIVEQSATLGVFNRRWGIPLIDGGTVRLPRMVGLGRALDLILTGRAIDAAEALAIGLANRVVEDGAARAEAEKLAAEIAQFPPDALRHDRLSAYEQMGMSMDAALKNEFRHGLAVIRQTDLQKNAREFGRGKGSRP